MVTPLPSAVSALKEGDRVLEKLDQITSAGTKHEDPDSAKTIKEQVDQVMTDLDEAIAAHDQDKIQKIAYHGRQIVGTAKKWNQFGLEQAQKEYQTAMEASQVNTTPETKAALDEAAAEVKLWSDSLAGLDDDMLEVNERIDAKVASMNTPDTTTVDTESTLIPVVPPEKVETRAEPEKVSGRAAKLLEYITTLKETMAEYEARLNELKLHKKTAADDFSKALTLEKIRAIKTEANIPAP